MTHPVFPAVHAFDPHGGLVVPKGERIVDLINPPLVRGTSYVDWNGPLFAAPPKQSDIVQGAIGDCFLLAGLNSLLMQPNGSIVLQSSMRDDGASVVLRMFKDGNWTYVRVTKQLMEANFRGPKMYNAGSKWVRLIEKAYAGYVVAGYAGLHAGGIAETVMSTFFGPAIAVEMTKAPRRGDDLLARDLFRRFASFYTGMELPPSKLAKTEADARGLFLSMDETRNAQLATDRAAAWKAWNSMEHEKELVAFSNRSSDESFDKLLLRIGTGLSADVRATLLAWYNKNQPFPGVLGSGLYTADQLEFHRRLSRAIATQHAVSVRTKNTLKGPVSGRLAGGETQVLGVVGRHAYSVVGTKEEPRGITPDTVTLLYIGVRNPWGNYSRAYTASGPMTPKRQDSAFFKQAVSWIELTDFTDNFQNDFVEGPQVHDTGRAALMGGNGGPSLQEQLQAKIDEMTLKKWGGGL